MEKKKQKAKNKKFNRYVNWTAKTEAAFLAVIADTYNITAACREVGISRAHAYTRRKNDEKFRKAWDDAVEEAVDTLEVEAWRRGRDGVETPLLHKGEQVVDKNKKALTIRKYSNSLLMFLLKGRRSEVFKDRLETKGTITIEDELSKLD